MGILSALLRAVAVASDSLVINYTFLGVFEIITNLKGVGLVVHEVFLYSCLWDSILDMDHSTYKASISVNVFQRDLTDRWLFL